LDELSSQLGERVDLILGKGPTPNGTPSTIVDITSGKPKLLREGAISFQQVLEIWETASD
jgi:L-threonylcarbamoyladenylate synthase